MTSLCDFFLASPCTFLILLESAIHLSNYCNVGRIVPIIFQPFPLSLLGLYKRLLAEEEMNIRALL